MANKFSQYFTDDMTAKQVDYRYYQLEDGIERGSQDAADLKEAHDEAWDAAWRRECEQMDEIEKNAPIGTTYIVCM